jgi:signal transduction histidine kinase
MLVAVVAAETGFLSPAAEALAWVGFQTAALAWLLAFVQGWAIAATTAGGALALELALAGAGLFAQRERALRVHMTAVNAELIATREIAAETTRIAERLQIARELHDSLGHQLTALRIQLELARHVAEGAAVEPIRRSSDLAKELLGEIREVVAGAREDRPLDLARAIDLLTAGIPAPRIRVTMAEGFLVRDHLVAHTLFRCVQESLTNTIRHAGARNVSIDLSIPPSGGHVVTVEDDGAGVAHVRRGHGLRGLEERLTRIGGRLEIRTSPGAGFTVRAFLPARPGAPEVVDPVASVDAAAVGGLA